MGIPSVPHRSRNAEQVATIFHLAWTAVADGSLTKKVFGSQVAAKEVFDFLVADGSLTKKVFGAPVVGHLRQQAGSQMVL